MRLMVGRLAVAGALAITGVSLLVLALDAKHAVGVALGCSGIALGVLTLVIERLKHSSACHQPPSSGFQSVSRLDADQDIPETKQRKMVCGMQPLCWLSVLNSILLAVLVMLVIVRVVTPDQDIGVFPSGCSKSLPIGCSRVAEEHPQRDEGQDPVALTSPATVVAQAVKEWAMNRRGHLLDFNHGEAGIFLHFRFLSTLWGFPDDFLALVRCTAEDKSLVEMQGQLRLGYGDMGVNPKRNLALIDHLRQTGRLLQQGPCTSNPSIET